MPTDTAILRHLFQGGWATDFGPNTDIAPGEQAQIGIPFLVDCENALYELDGGPRKMPGLAKLNSSQLESGAVIKGLFDYWDTGTGAISTQHRIVHVGTTIKRDNADGTFTDLFTGLISGAVPAYAVLEDVLVMATDHINDVPKSWNGTTAQNLAGSPPNFSFMVPHKNRMWAAGVEANSSRVYYSVLLNPEDWTGAGSGSIDIDPRDGDRITALASHRNELWIFKGSQRGSIHRITGSAPTGTDAFARKTFVIGVGAVGHNSIFRFANDLGFMWSDGTIRSLAVTDSFGDFAETALSRPINQGFLAERLNFARLKHVWIAVDDIRGIVVAVLPIDASTNNNAVISMDIRFAPPRWSFIPAIAAGCVASVIDPDDNDRRILMFGGNDGYVRKWGRADRSNDGTAIAYKTTTPYFTYGSPAMMKTISHASVAIRPWNNADITFGWQRDNVTQQTQTVAQGGEDVLGTASANQFTLDTSRLAGARFVDRFLDLEEGGEFRAIQYQVTDTADNTDIELHAIGAAIRGGAISTEN